MPVELPAVHIVAVDACAATIISAMHRHTPGAQSIAEYAMHAPKQPAVTFGYGVIDADAIPAAMASLRRAMELGSR